MSIEVEIQVRTPCDYCEGTGERKLQPGQVSTRISGTMPCMPCQGSGTKSARWVAITELRDLLRTVPD